MTPLFRSGIAPYYWGCFRSIGALRRVRMCSWLQQPAANPSQPISCQPATDYRGGVTNDVPGDPFHGDSPDPAGSLANQGWSGPLTPDEHEEVLSDLTDLDIFQALLESRGIRGIVVNCDDCDEPHYFEWDLLRSNLKYLLGRGRTRVHEPAYGPDPSRYVSWEYARGYADGMAHYDK